MAAKWASNWDGTKAIVVFDGIEYTADKGDREASFYELRFIAFSCNVSYDSPAMLKRKSELMRKLWNER